MLATEEGVAVHDEKTRRLVIVRRVGSANGPAGSMYVRDGGIHRRLHQPWSIVSPARTRIRALPASRGSNPSRALRSTWCDDSRMVRSSAVGLASLSLRPSW